MSPSLARPCGFTQRRSIPAPGSRSAQPGIQRAAPSRATLPGDRPQIPGSISAVNALVLPAGGAAEMEHSVRDELAPLDVADGYQDAPAGREDLALHRRVAPAQDHGLAPHQPQR